MSGSSRCIYQVHVADGFADDCEELVHRCSKFKRLSYQKFAGIWKELNMASIYQDRSVGAEIAELSEEVLLIAKRYMLANTSNFEESVAGLFLVYGLLNMQPFKRFAALKLVPKDVPAIWRIENIARRDQRMDVLYILGSILIAGPVQYHAANREYGFDPSLRKYLEGCTGIDSMGVRPRGVFSRQTEELDLIRELKSITSIYEDSKTNIKDEFGRRDNNLAYADRSLPAQLETSLRKIISGITDEEKEGELSSPASRTDPKNRMDLIRSIKDRAMIAPIAPIRHLTTTAALLPTEVSTTVEKEKSKKKSKSRKVNSPRKTTSPRNATSKNKKTIPTTTLLTSASKATSPRKASSKNKKTIPTTTSTLLTSAPKVTSPRKANSKNKKTIPTTTTLPLLPSAPKATSPQKVIDFRKKADTVLNVVNVKRSPKKAEAKSPRKNKRKTTKKKAKSPKKNTRKRKKRNVSSSSESSDITELLSEYEYDNQDDGDGEGNVGDETHDQPGNEVENTGIDIDNLVEKEYDVQIDSLPILITNTESQDIQIEFIDLAAKGKAAKRKAEPKRVCKAKRLKKNSKTKFAVTHVNNDDTSNTVVSNPYVENSKNESNSKDVSNSKDDSNCKDESNSKNDSNSKDVSNSKDDSNSKDESNYKDGSNSKDKLNSKDDSISIDETSSQGDVDSESSNKPAITYKLRRREKRDLKKPVLKSKFKKMGLQDLILNKEDEIDDK